MLRNKRLWTLFVTIFIFIGRLYAQMSTQNQATIYLNKADEALEVGLLNDAYTNITKAMQISKSTEDGIISTNILVVARIIYRQKLRGMMQNYDYLELNDIKKNLEKYPEVSTTEITKLVRQIEVEMQEEPNNDCNEKSSEISKNLKSYDLSIPDWFLLNFFGKTFCDSNEAIEYKLENEGWKKIESDNSVENFPIQSICFEKTDFKWHDIPIENIIFDFSADGTFFVSIVTDYLEINSFLELRKYLKSKYNFKLFSNLQLDNYFYSSELNHSFYINENDENIIMILEYRENYEGKIMSVVHFLDKCLGEKAILLKNEYKKYSHIENYTSYTLEELQQKEVELQNLRKEAEEKRVAEVTALREAEKERYEQEHKYDAVKNYFSSCTLSGFYLCGGGIFGESTGWMASSEWNLGVIGPLFTGGEIRLCGINVEYFDKYEQEIKTENRVRGDIDLCVGLGFALPFSDDFVPVISSAICLGLEFYKDPDEDSKQESYMDYKIGLDIPISSPLSVKFSYVKQNIFSSGEERNLFSIAFGFTSRE